MILCDREIIAALDHGHIKIDPRPERFQPSSVDLTLGEELWRWKPPVPGFSGAIDPGGPGYEYHTLAQGMLEPCPLEIDGSILLRRGLFMLGITRERVELPEASRLAARVEGRSSLARVGLGIHVTAPTIHVGFRGQITLEITNHGAHDLKLRPGMEICQLILEQVFGTPAAAMSGTFQDQTSVRGKP